MPTPARAAPRRVQRLARAAELSISMFAALAIAGCFDSDDKGLRAAPVGSTGDSTGVVDPDTSTGLPPRPPIDDGGNGTCAQALGCLTNCIGSIQQQIIMDVPELDLSCFLECDQELSIEQAVLLLDLFDCAAMHCSTATDDDGNVFCPKDMGGSSTGSGSGSGSSGSSGEPPPEPGLFDPCTECLFFTVGTDESPACADLRNMCQ